MSSAPGSSLLLLLLLVLLLLLFLDDESLAKMPRAEEDDEEDAGLRTRWRGGAVVENPEHHDASILPIVIAIDAATEANLLLVMSRRRMDVNGERDRADGI